MALSAYVRTLSTAILAEALVIIASALCALIVVERSMSAAVRGSVFIKTTRPVPFHVSCVATVKAIG